MSSEIRQTLAQAKAVYWLGRQLTLPFDYDLWGLLETLRQGGSAQFYEPRVIRQGKAPAAVRAKPPADGPAAPD